MPRIAKQKSSCAHCCEQFVNLAEHITKTHCSYKLTITHRYMMTKRFDRIRINHFDFRKIEPDGTETYSIHAYDNCYYFPGTLSKTNRTTIYKIDNIGNVQTFNGHISGIGRNGVVKLHALHGKINVHIQDDDKIYPNTI